MPQPWIIPVLISIAALTASAATVAVAWLSHRRASRSAYLTELAGEIALLREQLQSGKDRADDLRAVVDHQRQEIGVLTVAEAACRAENGRLNDRIAQMEGDIRQLRQTSESALRLRTKRRPLT